MISSALSRELLLKHLWLWLGPLLLLLVSVGLLSLYRTSYSLRVAQLEAQLLRERGQLEERKQQRVALEERLQVAESSRSGIERLYRETFATERERLTQVIRELRDLAARAGLVPSSVSYPEEHLEEYGLLRKSFVFSVEGDYSSLRRLINFLEVSPSFLTLERVQVSDTRRSDLAISLQLSTLFAAEPNETEAPERAVVGGGR